MESNLINYTARDFDSIKASVTEFLRTNHSSTWTDYMDSNAGIAMIDVIAYCTAIISWNLDKQINESFLTSAQFKSSVLRIAEQYGYKPTGRTSSSCIVDAELTQELEGILPIILRKGTIVKTLDGISFEVAQDTSITTGNLHPVFSVETSVNTVPSGSTLDFIAGDNWVRFTGRGSTHHHYGVHPGMYLRSKTSVDQSWYRIKQVSGDHTELFLEKPWNYLFNYPFLIRKGDNDLATLLCSSTPYGDFPSDALTHLGSRTVTVTSKLPLSVLPGQYFRFNTTICNTNQFFQISTISEDRLSFTLTEPFGPTEAGEFDCVGSDFEIQNHGLLLIQGESRFEEVVSTGASNIMLTLASNNIVSDSIEVYDESGVINTDGSPRKWVSVETLSDAFGELYRAYELILNENDNYSILFGNGTQGRIPTGKITVRYRIGLGSSGNVPPGSFNTKVVAYQGTKSYNVHVSNLNAAAAGGTDGETVTEIRRNIPKFHTSNMRAVTGEDYIYLILSEYAKDPSAVGLVTKASLNLTYNQIYYGGNLIYINCWETEGWNNSTGRESNPILHNSSVTYQRIIPIRNLIRTSVQNFIDKYKMVTDQPYVVRGNVDYGVIEMSIQLEDSSNSTKVLMEVESTLANLFNQGSVLNGNPLLMSDVYGAVEQVQGVLQMRLRKMYLNFEDVNGVVQETPEVFRGVYDLHPRSMNDIVTPESIRLLPWSHTEGIVLYIKATLCADTALAKESIRQALEKYFYDLEPGKGVTISELTKLLRNTPTGAIKAMVPCDAASGTLSQDPYHLNEIVAENVSMNISNSSNFSIGGVDITVPDGSLTSQHVVLLRHQDIPSENGIYLITTVKDPVNHTINRTIQRHPTSNSYKTMTIGSYTVIQSGNSAGKIFYFSPTEAITQDNFNLVGKPYVDANGSLLNVSNGVNVIDFTKPYSIKFDYPTGTTDTEKPAIDMQMYQLQILKINEF